MIKDDKKYDKNIYDVTFMKNLMDILNCICVRCSNLLINKEKIMVTKLKCCNSEKRFTEVMLMCKSIKNSDRNCGSRCGSPIYNTYFETKNDQYYNVYVVPMVLSKFFESGVSLDKLIKFSEVSMTKKIKLSPTVCRDILRSISNNDSELMGFEDLRPEQMFDGIL